jgi:hypothetical protein
MPRLVRGATWTYGWVLVGPGGEMTIPPEAWREFGFRAGDEAIFTPGSRTSGGFGVSTPGRMDEVSERLDGGALRVLARGRFGDGWVTAPPEVGVRPGDRLLAVRGSRYGLGFVAQGPIYAEALKHAELECFGEESET